MSGKPETCVGGPLDGQKRTILHGSRFRIGIDVPYSINVEKTHVKYFIYDRRLIRSAGTDDLITFWALESLSDTDAIRMMVESYLGEKK